MFTKAQAIADFLQHRSGKPCPLELQGDVLHEMRKRLAGEGAIIKALPSIKIIEMATQIEGKHVQGMGFEVTYGTLIDGPWQQLIALEAKGQGVTFAEAEEQTVIALCNRFRELVVPKLNPPRAS